MAEEESWKNERVLDEIIQGERVGLIDSGYTEKFKRPGSAPPTSLYFLNVRALESGQRLCRALPHELHGNSPVSGIRGVLQSQLRGEGFSGPAAAPRRPSADSRAHSPSPPLHSRQHRCLRGRHHEAPQVVVHARQDHGKHEPNHRRRRPPPQ